MTEVIYQHTQVMKIDFYQWIKSTLEANGWVNISSREADFDVYHSKGVSGTDELYFQMREYDTNVARKISNSVSSQFFLRALSSYTPSSTAGGAGTFLPASHAWMQTKITKSESYTNLLLDIYFYCDADKFTFIIESPAFLKYQAIHYYIGKPDYQKNGNIQKKCMVTASQSAGVYNYQIGYQNTRENVATVPTIQVYEIPRAVNASANTFFMTAPSFYNTIEGYFCKIDGIYFIPWDANRMSHTNNSFRGHTLVTPDGKKYRTTILVSDYGSSWAVYPEYAIAFRVE